MDLVKNLGGILIICEHVSGAICRNMQVKKCTITVSHVKKNKTANISLPYLTSIALIKICALNLFRVVNMNFI